MANPNNMATLPDTAQGYLNDLTKQLADALRDLNIAAAEQNSLQLEYTKTLAWKSQVCGCLDAIAQTNHQATLLINLLGTTGNQAGLVGQDAQLATQAFLHMLSDLQEVAKCVEALKSKVPTGNKTVGNVVSDACEKLAAALADAMKCAEGILKGMLEVYEKAQKLWKGVGDPGLHTSLGLITDYFTKKGPKADYTDCAGCTDADKPVFPLDDKQAGFYKDVKEACEKAEADLISLLQALQAAQKTKNTKQTCYDALKAAVDAATAAKACKK